MWFYLQQKGFSFEIRDLENRDEIENINKEIVRNLSKVNKNYDIID